ncbi:MAG: alpha/beta fold hydrolase [Evtepia sp.]
MDLINRRIPCTVQLNDEKKVVIICHGFGSSRKSPTVLALEQELPHHGIGSCSFDFPGHGENRASDLRIPNCLNDLGEVEAFVHAQQPKAEICYFASSFGAYILLTYLATRKHFGQKAFLRSAAVSMPKLFLEEWMTPALQEVIDKNGCLVLKDYPQEMCVSKAFLSDLEETDVFELYHKEYARLFMIHGGEDVVASPQDAERFAKQSGAQFYKVEKGAHQLMGVGELETVLSCATTFFKF